MAVHYVGHYQPQGQLYLRHVQHAAPGPTLTIQGRHRRMSAPPPPPPEACRRAPVRADGYQVLKRMPLQMRRVQEEERPQADFGRVPQPLPSQWRADFELSPMGYDLGGGAFAEVFRVQHQRSDKSFAVKVMHRPNFAMRGIERQIEAEIEAMRLAAGLARDLKEEIHILRLLDVCEEGEYVYLLLELCEQGDLLRKLNWEPTQRIAEQEAVIIAQELMIGLKHVHELGYIHRDIKPDNLLTTAQGELRIADFGWCCPKVEAPTCLAGTLLYMAPEVLQNVPQTVQADVWSAGMTLYQMMVGRPLLQVNLSPGATMLSEHDPHRATTLKQQWLLKEINSVCPPSLESRPRDVSEACWDFLRQALRVDPKHRITVHAAMCHPWVKLADSLKKEKKAADRAQARDEMPASPTPTRTKEARSPPSNRKDSISVPTPLKPRSYDPNRNMAYTPPVSPEPTPERTRWPQAEFHMPEKENSTDPEVSPERKTRLADKVSAKWSSPKDDLSEKLQAARVQIAKLASPQRQLTRPARKTIASGMPTWEVERGFGSPARENRPWKQPDEWSSEKPVNKVLEPMPEEEGPIYSSVKMPAYPREPMMRPLATDSDLLMTSAPHAYRDNRAMGRFPLDSRLQLRSPGAPPAQGQLLTPRAAERHPPLQAKMVPALPGNAGVNAPLGPGPTVVQSAACLRFQQGSPLRSRPQQMATAASSPVMTQVRRVAPAPAPGAFYAAPQLQQVPQLAQHARHAVPVMFAGRQSPLRMAAGAPVGTCLRLQTGPGPDAKA
ncbi:unnamed protein product [Effrenium voratum]|uniref:Protein kinase domain-containing protein n=1 Tax=Effrenium voratum TaxID=2562239 RepID=A0AA36I4R9_9DINO|nr:unnamed protein product [Effrenium voratum]CAJ1431694.1 unnamed protein product [Effrenium voratum]